MSSYFRIYCDTDDKWEYSWADIGVTQCPTNSEHTVIIDAHSPQQLVESDAVIKLREENIPNGEEPTQGRYMVKTIVLDIPLAVSGPETTTINHSFPFPIGLIEVVFTTEEEMKGDELLADMAEYTTVGLITEDVDIGVTATTDGISTNLTGMQNIYAGYKLRITDGVNTEDLGRVINVNKDECKIIVEDEPTNAYLSSSPTYLQITIPMTDIIIGPPKIYTLGNSTLGSTYIPKNTVGKFTYTNNEGSAKKLYIDIEYFY
jgi:hypothetical protein